MPYPFESELDPVEFLVLRKFPPQVQSVLAPLRSGRASSEGRHPSYGYRSHPNQDADAYREELRAMCPSEFEALLENEQKKFCAEVKAKQDEEEQRRFYNQPYAAANASYWGRAPYWTIEEAIALSFGKNPEVVSLDSLQRLNVISPFIVHYGRVRDFAMRACTMEQLYDPIVPVFFVDWMARMRFSFPEDLKEAVVLHSGALTDWKARYDDFYKIYQTNRTEWEQTAQNLQELAQQAMSERDAARTELESERQRAQEVSASEKPFGRRERESMLKMIAAMAIGGYAHKPAAQRSETVKQIVDDLQRQGANLSDDTVRRYLAEAIEHLKDISA